MRVAIVLGLVAAIAAPRIARADGVGVIAVADGGATPAVEAALASAIRGTTGGRVVGDAVGEARRALAAGAVPIGSLARFREVRDAIAEGWHAYLQVSIEFAASRLAGARTEAEQLLGVPGGLELYADVSLRLGAVLAHEGRIEESRAALRLALALDPDRPIALAEFSPDVDTAVKAARAATPTTTRVHVGSATAGIRVALAIDGKEVGEAPVELDLERGQHVIVARAPGYVAAGIAVAVDDAHSAFTVEPLIADDARRLDAGPRGAEDATDYVDTVATYAELDELVVATATERRGGPTLLVQRCAGRVGVPLRCSAVVELGYADASGLAAAAKAAWEAARVGELRYPPSVFARSDGGHRVAHRCEVCRSPWLWGGVAAAAIATTAIVLVVTSGSRPPPVVGVDPSTFTR